MKNLWLLTILLLSACVNNAPNIIKGKGGVYGQLSADSHPQFNRKLENNRTTDSMYGELNASGVKYQDNMVNYLQLDELYVGLIQPKWVPQHHQLIASTEGMLPRSIALAVGDTIELRNNTRQSLNFFVAEASTTGRVQTFPGLAAGATANLVVELEGDLELLSEENDNLKVAIFSQKNMLTRRVSSGDFYQFDNLDPGSYRLIFWFWRLGKIQQTIQIRADENLRVDKTLTVDSVIKSFK